MSESSFPLMRKFFSDLKGTRAEGRSILLPILLLCLAIALVSLGTCEGGSEEESSALSEQSLALDAYRQLEEEKLVTLLTRLDGVERCFVSITYSSGEESVREGSVTVSFEPPRVQSVVVLYDGESSLTLKRTVIDVVTTLYGIGANRVSVNLLSS